MINIRQSQTNTVSISSLESLVTIPNPVFIFKWVDSYNYTLIKSFLDQSAYPERYSEFIVTDGSDLTFKASGHCYIYESPVDASAIDPSTMNLLTSEQYTFIPIAIADYVYEPSLYTYNAVDTVFDPQFNTNTPSPTYILHDDLSGRTNPDNHPQYIKEASLGSDFIWNAGVLDVSTGGGGTDASVSELYDFYEDLSTYAHIQDASIADLYSEIENIPQDASIGELFIYVEDLSTLVHDETQDPSIVDIYETAIFGTASAGTGEILLNVVQYPGTLPAIKCSTLTAGTGVTFDISYGGVFGTDVDNITINASIGAIGKDPSIDDLYAVKADKTYVDGSLNAKQNLIPDGTYLKEASLGTGLVWNGGQLDVSVEGGSGAQDASIGELFIYVEDLSTYTYSHTHAQDASIVDLYNYTFDLSTRLDNFDPAQDASIGELFVYVEDLSTYTYSHTHTQDASIDDLYSVKADKSYVDASLNAKQDIIPAGTYVKEASLGDGLVWNGGLLDVSVEGGSGASSLSGLSDVSISSLSDKDALIYDASISKWKNVPTTDISSLYYERNYIDGSLNAKVNRTLFDSSIGNLSIRLNTTDTSLNTLKIRVDNQDGSINELFSSKQDERNYIDGSLNAKVNRTLFDSSLLSITNNDLSQDASILLRPLTTYVDGSLNLKMNIIDVSTTYLKINDASSNYAKRLTYFTVVNASTYLVNPSDNLNIIQCDTSTVITFPNTLEAGFSTTVMLNVSTGYVTLNASTFRATDASVRLKDMYAAATVVHQSSGVFYGFGNLK